MKLARFAHRVALSSESGNVLRHIHPERAQALLQSGVARTLSYYPIGLIDEIVLTNQLFVSPRNPKSFTDPRNRYLSRSSQDPNVPRGTQRAMWFKF